MLRLNLNCSPKNIEFECVVSPIFGNNTRVNNEQNVQKYVYCKVIIWHNKIENEVVPNKVTKLSGITLPEMRKLLVQLLN